MPAATPLNTTWDQRQQTLAMALKQAEALRAQGAAQPQGQMISGRFVAPAITQRLAPLVAALSGRMQEQNILKQQTDLAREMQQDAASWMAARPYSSPVKPNDPVGVPVGQAEQTTQATPQENAMWAQRGFNNPLTKAVAAELMKDQMVTQPAQQRKFDFDFQDRTRQLLQKDKELAFRMQDATLNRQQRADLQNQRLAVQRELSHASDAARIQAAQVGRSIINIGGKEAPIADAAASQQEMLSQGRAGLTRAADPYGTGTPVGAFITGAVEKGLPGGTSLVNLLRTSDDKDARQQLAFVASEWRKKMFGTQYTKVDREAAEAVIPNAFDSKQEVLRKAATLERLIAQTNARTAQRVQDAGLPFTPGPTPPQPSQPGGMAPAQEFTSQTGVNIPSFSTLGQDATAALTQTPTVPQAAPMPPTGRHWVYKNGQLVPRN